MLFKHKTPLEKSLSMPDMQNRFKKRERIRAYRRINIFFCSSFYKQNKIVQPFPIFFYSLREYNRSESERSFDEVQIRKARLQSLGLAYLSPQNKSLAQSFRYMRNKPTIIAFKTPSLENCEQRPSQNSIGSMSMFIELETNYFYKNHFIFVLSLKSRITWNLYTKTS